MRAVSARLLALALLLGACLAPRAWPGHAAPPAQLDQPLHTNTRCDPGFDDGAAQFTLAATGDTFPHENIQAVGETQGYDTLFDHVRPFLQAADLAYTNFDGAMLAGSPYTGYPNFNYNPALATALRNAGIDLVSTANNHILDRGPEGLDATLRVLEQAGIAQHGAVPSNAAAPRPAFLPITLTRDGASVKLAFLSFTWGTNGIPDPFNQVNLLWQGNDYGQQSSIRPEVLDAIAQARQAADLVIVAAHWGYEYQFEPNAPQLIGAQQMAAAGADVILGAQPHTLQPVDMIDTGGRKTLVIYSLANFLASQGAYQYPYYSATSVIFYIGFTRYADGRVQLNGYRYLPTVHIDADTRPAPIPPQGYEDVIAHVRQQMRDPGGLWQVSHDPAALDRHLEICPTLTLPDGQQLGGDFAQFFVTLGGTMPRPLTDALAVLGPPLGPPQAALGSDCQPTAVLVTEHQRLEWHPELDWPFRVSGAQLGVAAYQQRYGPGAVQRQTDLGSALTDQQFHTFFQTYGGLPVFGYPISSLLLEQDSASGQQLTVQYFERAKFERVPTAAPDAPLLEQVRLAALGRAFADAPNDCVSSPAGPTSVVPQAPGQPQAQAAAAPNTTMPPSATPAATALREAGTQPTPWRWPLLIIGVVLLATLLLGALIQADARARRARITRIRRRRQAAYARRAASDEELLTRLLEQQTPRLR